MQSELAEQATNKRDMGNRVVRWLKYLFQPNKKWKEENCPYIFWGISDPESFKVAIIEAAVGGKKEQ